MEKNRNKRKIERKKRTSILYNLTSRTVLFVFLLTFASSILFLSGNFQNFLDGTQRYLLRWCSIGCVLLVILDLACIVMSVIMFFATLSAKYWGYFFLQLLVLAFAVVIFVLMYFLAFVSTGIRI